MKYVHFFQWNIPSENHFFDKTDGYINIIAEWNTEHFYSNGDPIVFVDIVNATLYDCIKVKDWYAAEIQIKALAQNHFKELARQEKLAQARATLVAAGEPTGYPTLDRFTETEKDLIVQQTLS